MSWAAEELKTASLGDRRRNRRLIKIVEDLSAMPHASVTQAGADSAAVQGTYEFWANVLVKASEILAAHRDSTRERVADQSIVLAVQDTTELDFSSQSKTQGLGALSKKDALLVLVCTTFVHAIAFSLTLSTSSFEHFCPCCFSLGFSADGTSPPKIAPMTAHQKKLF